MNPAYATTRFSLESEPPPWPPAFAILTAHAPPGETWTGGENREADQRLRETLERLGVWMHRVVGHSPDRSHQERSWAVAISLEDALALGREFLQDAIFHVEHDMLSVIQCGPPGASVPMGRFTQRLNTQPLEP